MPRMLDAMRYQRKNVIVSLCLRLALLLLVLLHSRIPSTPVLPLLLELLPLLGCHGSQLFFKPAFPMTVSAAVIAMAPSFQKNIERTRSPAACQNVSVGPLKRSGINAFQRNMTPNPRTRTAATAISSTFPILYSHQGLIRVLSKRSEE